MHHDRHFLFLQGPHGPFWGSLGASLRRAGVKVCRIGFNAGDEAFWPKDGGYIPYTDPLADWPQTLRRIIRENRITDLVIYSDVRPIHAKAVDIAQDEGLRVHVFEEGYMRPYWVTYERDGSNGHSRLMSITIDQMAQTLDRTEVDLTTPPAHWGDMRQHVFYGAFYHWYVLFRNRKYRHFTRHRRHHLQAEAWAYTRQLLLLPWIALNRRIAMRRIIRGSFPYHVALMQLEHDASFQAHSPFEHTTDFITEVMEGFAKGAPKHHHLVFKAHPLEPEHEPLGKIIADKARKNGLSKRVHYVRGSKLAVLLDNACSAVTVNSTAALQVLWRGIPLKAFGRAVYSKPELVSQQALSGFFADPQKPNPEDCRTFRRYLLGTSQVPGGYYSAKGRRQLSRHVVDMMLRKENPYEALELETGRARTPDLKLVGPDTV